jgi:hypothetical protein
MPIPGSWPEVDMNRVARIILLSIILLLLAACAGPAEGISSAGKTPAHPNSIYEDDFSNPASGWETWSDANGSFVAYQNDGLRILVKDSQFDYWSRPGKRFVDARVEVDAVKLAGPNDNDFGLICRYQDRNNFYAFLASSDGYVGILKVENGKYKVISGAELSYSSILHQNEALNHLQADCIGSSLALSINGQLAARAQDSSFSAGEVGVIAGTNATPAVDIFFDNFVVSKP